MSKAFAAVCAALMMASIATLQAAELGVRFLGGGGLWEGLWTSDTIAFADDFGQTAAVSPLPVGSVLLRAVWGRSERISPFISLGLSTWGGRYYLSGGSGAERYSSVSIGAAEASIGALRRFSVGGGFIEAAAWGGVGAVDTPLSIKDTWSNVSAETRVVVPVDDSLFLFVGVSCGYGIPLDAFRFTVSVSGETGAATFDGLAADAVVFSRFGISFSVSYALTERRRVAP